MSFPSSGAPNPSDNAKQEDWAIYEEELHRFSETYGVAYGHPDDLKTLCDRFAEDAPFLLEFQAMIRSIIYRESFRATEPHLLALVGHAWGGAEAPDLNATTHAPVCDLAAFLRDAMKFPRLESQAPEENDEPPQVNDLADGDLIALTHSLEESASALRSFDEAGSTPVANFSEFEAPRTNPWWAESASSPTFIEAASQPQFLSQMELGTSQPTEPLTADPWQTHSTFHQELLRFAERREQARLKDLHD